MCGDHYFAFTVNEIVMLFGFHTVLTVVFTVCSLWISILARSCWWGSNKTENDPQLLSFTQHRRCTVRYIYKASLAVTAFARFTKLAVHIRSRMKCWLIAMLGFTKIWRIVLFSVWRDVLMRFTNVRNSSSRQLEYFQTFVLNSLVYKYRLAQSVEQKSTGGAFAIWLQVNSWSCSLISDLILL